MAQNDDDFGRTIAFNGPLIPQIGGTPDALGDYLVMIEGLDPGRRVELKEGEPTTIGRQAPQTLVLPDAELSRRHARVTVVDHKAAVEDLGSTNGTFVDGKRLTGPHTLSQGNIVRLGSQVFRYERRSKSDVAKSVALDRDLRKASNYVSSLLPQPLTSGAVLAEWRFVPSTQLGGDAFGYGWIDPDTFLFYLVDVSGHGVGSAMHSVTVLNVLRQRALPGVDFNDPPSVLSSLNDRFQMDIHNGLYFTMWYGVYHVAERKLVCGTAGHPPAQLVSPDRSSSEALGSPALTVGMMPIASYEVQQTTVAPGSTLYLFSDGVYEITTKNDEQWGQSDFLPLLLEPRAAAGGEAERIYQAVKKVAGPGPLEDDFSLMVITFP